MQLRQWLDPCRMHNVRIPWNVIYILKHIMTVIQNSKWDNTIFHLIVVSLLMFSKIQYRCDMLVGTDWIVHLLQKNTYTQNNAPWASCQKRKLAGCACSGNAGNVCPATDSKGNRKLSILACITARAWRTCRNPCREPKPRWRGKRSRPSWRMRNPKFYVSGKRPMGDLTLYILIILGHTRAKLSFDTN